MRLKQPNTVLVEDGAISGEKHAFPTITASPQFVGCTAARGEGLPAEKVWQPIRLREGREGRIRRELAHLDPKAEW